MKRIPFQSAFLIISFLVIEIVLRFVGYKPGDISPGWMNFKPVDSLYVISDFKTNAEGILIADSNTMKVSNTVVNSDGFRTKEFAAIDSTKKKVLFTGDSFTWGLSAKPLSNCFVDLIRTETNYEVINLGIPATDPPQYLALAQKYIPALKPDMVFIVFFMWNDLMQNDRKVSPDEPIYFMTNAGALLADIDGKQFHTAQAAYDYCVNQKYFLQNPHNTFEWAISKSALLSRLYSVRFRLEEKLRYEKTVNDSYITKKYLQGIKKTADENKVPVKFVLIPAKNEADLDLEKYKQRYNSLLGDADLKNNWLLLTNSPSYFTEYPDAHLNNKGHRVYADSLKQYLNNYFDKQ